MTDHELNQHLDYLDKCHEEEIAHGDYLGDLQREEGTETASAERDNPAIPTSEYQE